jgi:heme-degrading monooxygenase HmoA
MFIAVTRIKDVHPAAIDRMVEGFRHGAQELKAFPGFVGFELRRTENGLEAVSRWESRQAMEAGIRTVAVVPPLRRQFV